MKSFRMDCHEEQKQFIIKENGEVIKHKPFWHCSNHPHNYYFEILTETGIIGISLVFLIALLFIVFIFKNFSLLQGIKMENLFLLSATISLFLEAFPIKSTGSIFTTNNAAYLILISSIVISYKKMLLNKK